MYRHSQRQCVQRESYRQRMERVYGYIYAYCLFLCTKIFESVRRAMKKEREKNEKQERFLPSRRDLLDSILIYLFLFHINIYMLIYAGSVLRQKIKTQRYVLKTI